MTGLSRVEPQRDETYEQRRDFLLYDDSHDERSAVGARCTRISLRKRMSYTWGETGNSSQVKTYSMNRRADTQYIGGENDRTG